MRYLPLLLLTACAEMALPPTFPRAAAGQPVVAEQALAGLSDAGDAAVVQLIDADGAAPELSLAVFDRNGGPTRVVDTAPPEVARAVALQVRASGRKPFPVLAEIALAAWPLAFQRAAELGFPSRPPAAPVPGRRRWTVAGLPQTGSLPLSLRLSASPGALALLLSERPAGGDADDEVELARMTLSGAQVAPDLWVQGGVAWLLSGSVLEGEPLHRAVGVRRGSLARGEAQLHNAHGLADYAAGDLDAARREFGRAIAADPTFVDGLYNGASAAALSDRDEEAVALLRRAVAVDPGRVQVLGRDDDDLKLLRRRPDVRALLGLRRPPPENLAPPP